jgi:hypothetical protein
VRSSFFGAIPADQYLVAPFMYLPVHALGPAKSLMGVGFPGNALRACTALYTTYLTASYWPKMTCRRAERAL